MSAQCAQGHTGHLCSRCGAGYGQRLSSTVGACEPCAGAAQIVVLYITAALASMCFIKLRCYLNAQTGAGLAVLVSSHMSSAASTAHLLAPRTSSAASNQSAQQPGSSPLGVNRTPGVADPAPAAEPKPATAFLPAATAPQGMASTQGSAISLSARTPTSQSSLAAVQALQTKACVGDLLKPCVIYLQASDELSLCLLNRRAV